MQGRRIRKAAGINKSQGLSWSFRENEKKKFISPNSSYGLYSPPSLLFNGHRKSFTRPKRPEHEVDDSLASSAGVRKQCSYTSTVPYTFVASTGTALPSPFFDDIYSR